MNPMDEILRDKRISVRKDLSVKGKKTPDG
jgi:hypothetical protein